MDTKKNYNIWRQHGLGAGREGQASALQSSETYNSKYSRNEFMANM